MLRASAQILGRGTFGTAYMGSFDNGDTIMVRRLRVVIAFGELQQHMEIIGRIRHEHVAKLRAYCLKTEEVLLVYEYYNQNSIYALLHEVPRHKNVSQASDVYSFGVVLLELVSGRRTQGTTILGKVVSIVHWIQSLSPDDWTAKVIDRHLRHQHEEAMVQVLQIGMGCAAAVPNRRPKMAQVVRMLEEISGMEPSYESRQEDGSIESILEDEDGLEQTSSESSLEDLLEYGFLSP
ncbi:putative inactive receptor-like protein kinase [Sesamum alatum]|uniref:Inactive receptor-like protein kinase n=1 Tax=Sesamum alatum TaxID=300844 RepID=A0AAE1YKX9_9LAMI|nr:putative inactive receptor-like protein kinase [Sesamum alatum]